MDAGLYLRISQDRREEDATGQLQPTLLGVNRQEEDCRALATGLGWNVVEVYVDNDVSASTGKPRPAYQRMLQDVAAGRIGGIIAWHTDRLYRRPLDLEELIPICEQYHVLIRTVRSGELDLSTPTGRLLGRLLAASARHEVEHKADRWQRAVVQNRKAGKWPNSRDRLFGYTRDGFPHPDEAPRVRWIAEQVLSGRSLSGIARELNDLDVTTTRGNRWQRSSVRHLLLNPRLAGHATLTPRTARKAKAMRQPTIVGKGGWEPVLEPATWERVVAALSPYRARPPRTAVLSGLIYCHCGTRMQSARRGAKRGWHRSYQCPYDVGCGNISIAAVQVEPMVESYARVKLDDPRFRQAVRARTIAAPRASALARKFDQLRGRQQELAAALTDPLGQSVTVIRRALADVETKLAATGEALQSMAPVRLPEPRKWPTNVEIRSGLISLAVQRVTIMPNPVRGGSRFRPERVRIDPIIPEPGTAT